jgi:hypothetical protein
MENSSELRKHNASSMREVLNGEVEAESVRVQLTLKPKHAQELEDMKTLAELPSYAEVVRLALRLLKAVLKHTSKGGQVLIRKENGDIVEVLVL